jgi:integrase
MGVKTAKKDEGGIIRNHLIPEFGNERLSGLIHRRNVEGFARIWAKCNAPKTVHNIHIVFDAILESAVREELLISKPPALSVRHGELPALQDAKPDGWRETALFTLDEIAKLLVAEHIDPQYRVMYCVYFLTGSRFSEVTSVRVYDYNRNRKPLGQLTIRSAKSGRAKGTRYRTPPVHHALAMWLDWWISEGFEFTHLHAPQPHELLFPTLSPRRQKAGEEMCSHGEVYKRWSRHHLPGCGLRHRRLHDARRTLLSLIRSSEAPAEIARAITHTVIADKVLDAYTTFEWQAICKAVLSVDWKLPAPPGLATVAPEVIDLASRRGS